MESVQTGPRFVKIVRHFCQTQLLSEVPAAARDGTVAS